jgi:hypothetical protein
MRSLRRYHWPNCCSDRARNWVFPAETTRTRLTVFEKIDICPNAMAACRDTTGRQIMILAAGEKVHIIHRQSFDGDTRRHFVGTVEACDGNLAKVNGYLFAMDKKSNRFVKHDPELRTRIIALTSGMLIINVLPPHVEIGKINYKHSSVDHIVVSDGSDWQLDLSHL